LKKIHDSVVTRYTVHHFPNIENTIGTPNNVNNGQICIDPTPNGIDDIGFVGDYMKQRDDGHIIYKI
jgi:hypothetical protein